MHNTDTVDYGVVVGGEIILELDNGKTVHFPQGDGRVQNETRHRWRNPLSEPCLMAFILVIFSYAAGLAALGKCGTLERSDELSNLTLQTHC